MTRENNFDSVFQCQKHRPVGQDGTGAEFQNPKVDTCFAATKGEAHHDWNFVING